MAQKIGNSKRNTLRLKKIPVQTYLEPEQAEALKALNARTRVPMQEYIREGVDIVLAKYRRVK